MNTNWAVDIKVNLETVKRLEENLHDPKSHKDLGTIHEVKPRQVRFHRSSSCLFLQRCHEHNDEASRGLEEKVRNLP